MTSNDIYKAALAKAILNGFNHGLSSTYTEEERFKVLLNWNPYEIMFNHNFAKALWGDVDALYLGKVSGKAKITLGSQWQYHLQMMILEAEPIKYLEQFL